MHVAVVDAEISAERVAADRAEYEAFVELLSEREAEFSVPVARHEMRLDAIEDLREFVSELEPPPATNAVDLLAFYEAITYYPFTANRACFDIFLNRNSTVMGARVPEFLEPRSPEAAGLWHKLMGHWDAAGELADLDPPYQFYVDGERHLVEPERARVGFLQGEELDRLSAALRPHLPDVPEFYESLDEKYRTRAEWAAPVELVYALATCCGWSDEDLLLSVGY